MSQFDHEIEIILKGRTASSDMANVQVLLGYSQADFQKGFDIALEMQNRNLVKLLYSNFNSNVINVEFTLLA